MITLYTSYYIDDNEERQKELDKCLANNIGNVLLDKIVLLLEYPIDNELTQNKKVSYRFIKGRPQYNTFFELINSESIPNEWNIISNTDIYFDNTLTHLDKYDSTYMIALNRYDVNGSKITFMNSRDSQDAWIFKGKVNGVNGDFPLGQAGCDNAIAARFNNAGYKVISPSKTIKAYHLHNSGVRTYNPQNKVSQPYLLIPPTA